MQQNHVLWAWLFILSWLLDGEMAGDGTVPGWIDLPAKASGRGYDRPPSSHNHLLYSSRRAPIL